jgi:hypothetical protein
MASTLGLNANWDLYVGSDGNIALLSDAPSAGQPSALAQDAASAIQTYLGECFWDVTTGVPWVQQILGQSPPLALLKEQLVDAALTVSGVAAAQVFISSFSGRAVAGQVQVVGAATGQVSAANFSVTDPQGSG